MESIKDVGFKRFLDLPVEKQEDILVHASLFKDRKDANTAMQNMRRVSRHTNSLVESSPALRQATSTLQEYPGIRDRYNAAEADVRNGMTAPQAIARQGMDNPRAIDMLRNDAGRADVRNGMTAPQAIARQGMDNPRAIDMLHRQAAG